MKAIFALFICLAAATGFAANWPQWRGLDLTKLDFPRQTFPQPGARRKMSFGPLRCQYFLPRYSDDADDSAFHQLTGRGWQFIIDVP